MSIADLPFFLLSSVGLTFIIVYGSIFQKVRDWLYNQAQCPVIAVVAPIYRWTSGLIHCVQCTGFWSGVAVGLYFVGLEPFGLLLCGCASSVAGIVVDKTLLFMHREPTAPSEVLLPDEPDLPGDQL